MPHELTTVKQLFIQMMDAVRVANKHPEQWAGDPKGKVQAFTGKFARPLDDAYNRLGAFDKEEFLAWRDKYLYEWRKR